MHYFYIMRCKDKSLYCGSTKDIKKREDQHNSGKGSRYVHSRGGGKIIYFERFKTINRALRREAEVKKFTKIKKEKLIKKES